MQRRLKEREKEMEADARDRQREKEEIEDIKRKLIEEGHPDLDNELARVRSNLLVSTLKISSYQIFILVKTNTMLFFNID